MPRKRRFPAPKEDLPILEAGTFFNTLRARCDRGPAGRTIAYTITAIRRSLGVNPHIVVQVEGGARFYLPDGVVSARGVYVYNPRQPVQITFDEDGKPVSAIMEDREPDRQGDAL